jgi:hypothetical protein
MTDYLKKLDLYKKLREYKKYLFDEYSLKSYAQEGEDMILNRFFEGVKNGFYVDIGAHHPFRFSNTYHFYLKGWHGINADAMQGGMLIFDQYRKRDINIETGVGKCKKTSKYFIFEDGAHNGFYDESKIEVNRIKSKLLKSIMIPTIPLKHLLDKHLPLGRKINFLTVDVEGYDLEVLESNDWKKYRPDFVLVEIWFDDSSSQENLIGNFMKIIDYKLVAMSKNTVFFKNCLC